VSDEKVVAVGLLTQHDLDVLGRTFTRHFPVRDNDDAFADLMKQLERVPAVGGGARG